MAVNLIQAKKEVIQYKLWKDHLLKKHPELSDDLTALLDTLEGLTEVNEIIEALGKELNEREAMVRGLNSLIEEYQAKKARHVNGIQKIREWTFYIMQECGLKKVPVPTMTPVVSRTAPSVRIINQDILPGKFKIPQAPKIDLEAIRKALLAGEEVEGAMLSNGGEHLTIRRS